jgi:hypothetical protein
MEVIASMDGLTEKDESETTCSILTRDTIQELSFFHEISEHGENFIPRLTVF